MILLLFAHSFASRCRQQQHRRRRSRRSLIHKAHAKDLKKTTTRRWRVYGLYANAATHLSIHPSSIGLWCTLRAVYQTGSRSAQIMRNLHMGLVLFGFLFALFYRLCITLCLCMCIISDVPLEQRVGRRMANTLQIFQKDIDTNNWILPSAQE